MTDTFAHDSWSSGEQVPSWVSSARCGPKDVHHLQPEQVGRNAAGDYVVNIYPWPIPARVALPSQDGDFWVFFHEDFGVYGRIRCFFVPMTFWGFGRLRAPAQDADAHSWEKFPVPGRRESSELGQLMIAIVQRTPSAKDCFLAPTARPKGRP